MRRETMAMTLMDEGRRAHYAQECFMLYISYKKACAAECTQPVTYGAWLWLRGLSNQRPW
jgi:hypothetical protein